MTTLMNVVGYGVSTVIARSILPDVRPTHVPANTTINVTVSTQTDYRGLEPVQVIYLIVGALDVGVAMVSMLTCIWLSARDGQCSSGRKEYYKEANDDVVPLIPDSSDTAVDGDDHVSNIDQTLKPCSCQGCLLLTLILSFLFVAKARKFSFDFLLFTYLYLYRKWSVKAGTAMLLVNAITQFFVGVVMVPVSRWVSPTKLQIFNLSMVTISGVLMVLAPVLGDICVAASVFFEGAGTSNVVSTTITLLEETTHVVASLMSLFFSVNAASMLIGFVIGTLLYYTGGSAFPVVTLILVLISVALFTAYKVVNACYMKSTGRHQEVN